MATHRQTIGLEIPDEGFLKGSLKGSAEGPFKKNLQNAFKSPSKSMSLMREASREEMKVLKTGLAGPEKIKGKI